MVAFTCSDQEGPIAAVVVHEDALGLPASEVSVVPAAVMSTAGCVYILIHSKYQVQTHTIYVVLVCVVGEYT